LLDVVPEAGGIDRPILEGEAPDPTKIPKGCRFHPRCPVVATGRAAELGILEKCTGEDLMIEPFGPDHGVACWATKMGETPRISSVSAASDPGSSEPGSSG
jgi:peptide/nickel transport system ATP-binding protein